MRGTLLEELAGAPGGQAATSAATAAAAAAAAEGDVEGDDQALQRMEAWVPRPVEAAVSGRAAARSSGGGGDLLGVLVGIYGSREVFVQEYRALLAERLLTRADYGADREIETLELLKLRFGEAPLHVCEVMLKDLADSRRLDAAVHQQQAKAAAAAAASTSALPPAAAAVSPWAHVQASGSLWESRVEQAHSREPAGHSNRPDLDIPPPPLLRWRCRAGGRDLASGGMARVPLPAGRPLCSAVLASFLFTLLLCLAVLVSLPMCPRFDSFRVRARHAAACGVLGPRTLP